MLQSISRKLMLSQRGAPRGAINASDEEPRSLADCSAVGAAPASAPLRRKTPNPNPNPSPNFNRGLRGLHRSSSSKNDRCSLPPETDLSASMNLEFLISRSPAGRDEEFERFSDSGVGGGGYSMSQSIGDFPESWKSHMPFEYSESLPNTPQVTPKHHRARSLKETMLGRRYASQDEETPRVQRKGSNKTTVKLRRSKSSIKDFLRHRTHVEYTPPDPSKRNNNDDFAFIVTLSDLMTDMDFEVQRISEYDQFLQDLLLDTDRSHPDFDDLSKAALKVRSMVKERQEEVEQAANENKVEGVQERFPNDNLRLLKAAEDKKERSGSGPGRRRSAPGAVLLKTLSKRRQSKESSEVRSVLPDNAETHPGSANPAVSRLYVFEGPVQLTSGVQTQDRYLFLFNDLLLVAKQKSSTTFKMKHRVRVCEMWTAHCLDDVSETTRVTDRSFVVGWPTTNYVATFSTAEIRQLWLDKLTEQISSEKEREEPKTIVVKISNRSDKFQSSKCITVGDYEEAHKVVQRCTEEFHIQNAEPQDYQLWVISGKEDSPYPLIGHEHPYSIKMSHVRDAMKEHGQEGQVATEMQLTDSSVKCQFILRETKKPPRKLSLNEPNKRSRKVKKSPLGNLFRRKSHPPVGGKLFGQALCDLCQADDKLPQPIMELLHHLFIRGPFMPGIFRKSANHSKYQDVRAKLDSQQECCIEELPVLVAAALLKDFLRSLPDCLFLCDMYEQWVAVLDSETEVEKINRFRHLLMKLPGCHQNMLRHLVCVLYHVDAKSQENNMDAYNIAVCIGPSLLWPDLTGGLAQQAKAAERVPVMVQFLIRHCAAVFGSGCARLLGEPEQMKPRQDSSTDSDSTHSMLSIPDPNGLERRDNSSLDSLERVCFVGEMDSSPQLVKSHLSPTNLSRDSGLTASDPRLYEDGNESEASSVTQQRKQSITRSVSQFEEPRPSADPGPLSSSYEGGLTCSSVPPVPPPRKGRRRTQGVGNMETTSPDDKAQHISSQAIPIMHHSASSQTFTDYRRMNYKKASSKRVSDDSLGSVDEYSEMDVMSAQDSLNMLRDMHQEADMGILHKSESGARLFLDENPVGRAKRDHRRSAPPQMYNLGMSTDSHCDRNTKAQQRRDNTEGARLHRAHTDPFSQWSANNGARLSSSCNVPSAAIPESQVLNLNASYPRAKFNLSPPESPGCDDFVKDTSFMHRPNLQRASRDSGVFGSSTNSDQPMLSPSEHSPPPRPPEPMDYTPTSAHEEEFLGTPATRPRLATPMSAETRAQAAEQQSSPSSRARRLERSDAVDSSESGGSNSTLRRHRVGMTPKGGDFFPSKIYRFSLDEEQILSMKQKSAQQQQQQQQPSNIGGEFPSSSHQVAAAAAACGSDCHSFSVSPDTAVSKFRSRAMGKSASDTSLHEHFEASSPSAPRRLPTYEEAIQRRSQTEQEEQVRQQHEHSAKAKQLYEESLKMYELQDGEVPSQQSSVAEALSTAARPGRASRESTPVKRDHDESTSPRRGALLGATSPTRSNSDVGQRQPPPSYEQACLRAARIREQKEQRDAAIVSAKRKQEESPPPPYSRPKDRTDALKHDASSSSPLRSSSFTSKETTSKTRSRESLMGRSDSDRSVLRQREKRSSTHSRERRRAQRYSDPRLTSSPSKYLHRTQVHRSKSDSSEHLEKVGRFKSLQAYENKENISLQDLHRKHGRADHSTPEKTYALAERWRSEERVKVDSKSDARTRRKSVPASVLSEAADALQEKMLKQESMYRQRRVSVPTTVRNKDWHKELAEQYNHVFYQPLAVPQHVFTAAQYAHVTPVKLDSKDTTTTPDRRRRWSKPAHPTKDFVFIVPRDSPPSPAKTVQRSGSKKDSNHGNAAHSVTRTDSARSGVAAPAARGEVRHVGERPRAAITDSPARQKKDTVSASPPCPPNTSHTPMEAETSQLPSAESASQINWSVARLRHLYDQQKKTSGGASPKSSPFYSPNSGPPRGTFEQREQEVTLMPTNTHTRGQHSSGSAYSGTPASSRSGSSARSTPEKRPAGSEATPVVHRQSPRGRPVKERTNPNAELSYV